MRRWNGRGDESIHVTPPEEIIRLLRLSLDEGRTRADTTLDSLLRRVPACRRPSHFGIQTNTHTCVYLFHAQSLLDRIGLRSGNRKYFPDGVAFPENDPEVEDLLLRRARIGMQCHQGGNAHLRNIQKWCRPRLRWDGPRWRHEIRRDTIIWESNYALPPSPSKPLSGRNPGAVSRINPLLGAIRGKPRPRVGLQVTVNPFGRFACGKPIN